MIAFDAAILEEIAFRLLLVSLVMWLISRAALPSHGWPLFLRAWVSITVVALLFGLAHLPKWLASAPASPGLVVSVVLINAIGGLTFDALYLRFGIESAMAGHFAADAVLHVLGDSLSWG